MQPIPPDQWDPSLQHIIDDMHGRPIQIHCLLANHPALLNAWWSYRMHSVQGGDLEQRDCELVILRVAVHMQAWYEWAAHVDRGLVAGLSLDEIYRVAEGPSAVAWNEKDSALLSAVDQLIGERTINQATQTRLENFFSAKQVMDIAAGTNDNAIIVPDTEITTLGSVAVAASSILDVPWGDRLRFAWIIVDDSASASFTFAITAHFRV